MEAKINLDEPLAILVPAVREYAETLIRQNKKIAQYRFGFYRLPFTDSRLDEGLYLHIWLNELASEDLPHQHIFDLRSRILKGSLTNKIWEANPDPNGEFSMVKAVCDETTCRDITLAQKASLRCIGTATLEANDIYEIPQGKIHTTVINKFPTVTLMQKNNIRTDYQPVHFVKAGSGLHELKEFDFYDDHDNDKAKEIVLNVLSSL